jgi:hypothetical protein
MSALILVMVCNLSSAFFPSGHKDLILVQARLNSLRVFWFLGCIFFTICWFPFLRRGFPRGLPVVYIPLAGFLHGGFYIFFFSFLAGDDVAGTLPRPFAEYLSGCHLPLGELVAAWTLFCA